MSSKKNSNPAPAGKSLPPGLGLEKLLKIADKNAGMKGKLSLASDIKEDYIDFVDVTDGGQRPCILLEYLFSCRGLSTGRVVKIDAEEATGKSSFLYLLYGMAQRKNTYTVIHETERAVMPPDRIGRLGCNPDQLIVYRPGDVDDCLETTEKMVLSIRNELDSSRTYPIYVGVDSISQLPGTECDPETGEPLDPKGKGLGYHARRFSEFFRDKLQFLATNRVVLLGTGQHKTGFAMLPGGRQMAAGKTSLAEGPFKFAASWIVNLRTQKISEEPSAELVLCKISKNKLGPKNREIALRLYNDERGWDFSPGTASLLFSSFSPFGDKMDGKTELWGAKPGGMYFHHMVEGGKSMRARDFVNAFYANTELLMACRQAWKIRGFGFQFEEITPILGGPSAEDKEEDQEDGGA